MRQQRALMWLGLTVVVGMVLYGPDAVAQDQTQQRYDGILDAFRDQSIRWQGVLSMSASYLFFGLAVMQLCWTNMSLALKGGDASDFVSTNVKQLLGTGVMYVFLVHSFDWSSAIIMSFRQAGERAVMASAGGAMSSIDPAGIFQNGLVVSGSLFAQMSIWSGADNVALVICALVMMVCFAFLAAFMAVAIIESYIIIGGSVLLLGFGGSSWTGDIARKTLMYAVSCGAKLFVMQLIVGVAMGSVISWAQTYEQDSSTSTLSLIGLVLLVTIMAKMIPELVQGILSGVSVGGSSAMVSTIAAAAAVAATGAAVVVAAPAALAGGAAIGGGAAAAGGTGAASGAAAGGGGLATTGAQGAAAAGAAGSSLTGAAGGTAMASGGELAGAASAAEPLGPLGAMGRVSDAIPTPGSPSVGLGARESGSGQAGGVIRGAGASEAPAFDRAAGAGEATAGGGAAAPAPDALVAGPGPAPQAAPAGFGASMAKAMGTANAPAVTSPALGGSSSAGPVAAQAVGVGAGEGGPGPAASSVSRDDAVPTALPSTQSAPGTAPATLDDRAVSAESSGDVSSLSGVAGNLMKMGGHIVDTGSGLNPNAAVAPIAELGDGDMSDAGDKPAPARSGAIPISSASAPASSGSEGGVIRGAGAPVHDDMTARRAGAALDAAKAKLVHSPQGDNNDRGKTNE